MAIDADEFWGTNFYENPPLTDSMIAEAERQLAVRLPASYLNLLRIQNGGYTRVAFACPLRHDASRIEDCITLDELSGIVPGADIATGGVHNILLTDYMTNEWGLPPRQVLLAGDGHTWVSLDYRELEQPRVVWLDAECETETYVASSFDEFLLRLRPASEFE